MSKNTTFSAIQRLTRAHVWLMRSPNWVGIYPTVTIGESVVVTDEKQWKAGGMKTAYTNGRDTFYWHEFIDGLTEEELRFVVIHENGGHKMHRHLVNWMHLFRQNPMLANIAADYYTNAWILSHNDAGVSMPKEAIFDAKYADSDKYDVTTIYKDLLKNAKSQPKCNGNCQQGQGGGQPSGGQCTCPQGFDMHGWGESEGMSPAEQQQLAQDIDQAIRQGQKLASAMGSGGDRAIGDLLKVKTDWRAALRDFLMTYVRGGDEQSWARVSRRGVAAGELMPGSITEAMGELLIGADVSGSISQEELTCFLSHVAKIVQTIKPIRIVLTYWDTETHGCEIYEPRQYPDIAKLTVVRGGGGTNPECLIPFIAKNKLKPEVAVILSDGYLFGATPDFGVPTVWGITGNKSFQPAAGQKVIQFPDDWQN